MPAAFRSFPLLALLSASTGAALAQAPVLVDTQKATMPRIMAPTLAIWACDVDTDNWPDLVVGTDSDRILIPRYPATSSHVLGNLGDGRLCNLTPPAPLVQRVFHAVGDFDGDGDEDLFYREGPSGMGFAENDGFGAFTYHGGVLAYMSNRSWVAADLDGDTDLDLCSGLELLVNGGGFGFTVSTTPLPTTFAAPPAIAAADLDGDNDVDLMLGDGSGPVQLWLNDGAGVFTDASGTNLPAGGSPPTAIVTMDVEGDLDLDVFVGHAGDRPTLYVNDGNGAFSMLQPQRFYDVLSLAPGDLDGDSLPDIALGLSQGGVVLKNLGGWFGHIATPGWLPGPAPITALCAVDLDRDGDLDLVAGGDRLPTGPQPNGLADRVFWGDGAGGFRGPDAGALPLNVGGATLASGDFDGDGDGDVLDTGVGSMLWRNDGWGAFTAEALALPVAGEPVVGDLDDDGDLDAVVMDETGGFHVLINPGDGRLFPRQSHWLPPLPPSGRVEAGRLGDLDGDGDLDLFVATWANVGPSGTGAADAVWHNDGGGWFTDASALLPGSLTAATDAALGDLDRDGDLDIVTTGQVVYERQPAGYVARTFLMSSSGESHIELADLDGDGWLDLIVGNACRGIGCAPSGAGAWDAVLWNDGAGTLGSSQWLETQNSMATSVAVADFDADGDLDFVIGHFGHTAGADNPAENVLYSNDGGRALHRAGGAFALDEFPLDYDDTMALLAFDADGDGDPDLVAGNRAVDPGGSPRTKVHASAARQLVTPELLRLGQSFLLRVHGADFGAAVFASTVPARVALPPHGVLGLSPDHAMTLAWLPAPAAGSVVELDLPVPNAPALNGLVFWFQAIVGGQSPTEMRLTNRVQETASTH